MAPNKIKMRPNKDFDTNRDFLTLIVWFLPQKWLFLTISLEKGLKKVLKMVY
jgi:hypothetical protein